MSDQKKILRTEAGIPVRDNQNAQTAGVTGPAWRRLTVLGVCAARKAMAIRVGRAPRYYLKRRMFDNVTGFL